MTTFAAIADSDIDPESPVTTTLMTRMRDNAVAIGEGDVTVPNNIVYGKLIAFHTITASNAAWTPNAKTRRIIVECLGGDGGGGGGGGGGSFDGFPTKGGNGGTGGGARNIARAVINSITPTFNAVVGAAGAGGVGGNYADGTSGTSGGNSSFGGVAVAIGGSGGGGGARGSIISSAWGADGGSPSGANNLYLSGGGGGSGAYDIGTNGASGGKAGVIYVYEYT